MGKSSQPDQVTSTSEPWGPAQPHLRDVMSQASHQFHTGDPTVGWFNRDQSQGQRSQRDYAEGGIQPFIDQYQQAGMFGLSPDILNASSNPALQSHMQGAIRPIQQQLTENILPALRSQGTMFGDGGTNSRQGMAEGIASGRALDAMGDITSRMGSQAYGQGLQHQSRTSAMFPQMLQSGMMPGNILQNIGRENRNIETERLRDPWNRIQSYANVLNPLGALGGSQTDPSYQQGGGLMGALGGASTGAGLAGALSMGSAWPLAALGGLAGLFS